MERLRSAVGNTPWGHVCNMSTRNHFRPPRLQQNQMKQRGGLELRSARILLAPRALVGHAASNSLVRCAAHSRVGGDESRSSCQDGHHFDDVEARATRRADLVAQARRHQEGERRVAPLVFSWKGREEAERRAALQKRVGPKLENHRLIGRRVAVAERVSQRHLDRARRREHPKLRPALHYERIARTHAVEPTPQVDRFVGVGAVDVGLHHTQPAQSLVDKARSHGELLLDRLGLIAIHMRAPARHVESAQVAVERLERRGGVQAQRKHVRVREMGQASVLVLLEVAERQTCGPAFVQSAVWKCARIGAGLAVQNVTEAVEVILGARPLKLVHNGRNTLRHALVELGLVHSEKGNDAKR
mmetsp:Transcript_28030/g.58933  ORF Transcript_28030/g.58933 Transcript_28030/m.58933 type:complete len:359 (-) Transcript_28030:292-1368(-)